VAAKATQTANVRTGCVVLVGPDASVQFGAGRGFRFRVIRVHDWRASWEGWAWLDGYVLSAAGDAVERRSIYVLVAGLRAVGLAPRRGR
jgi:hypothetical protein